MKVLIPSVGKICKRVRPVLVVVAYLALWIIVMALLSALVPDVNVVNHPFMAWIVGELPLLVSALVVTLVFLRFVDHRPLSVLGLSLRGRGGDLLAGALTAVAIYAIGFTVSLAADFVSVESVRLDFMSLISSFLLCALVSFTEELVFRGYILGRLLRDEVGRCASLVLSSLLFSLLHLGNQGITPFCLLNIFIAGGMLGLCYTYTRNLCFSFSLHLFWNWIQGPLLGYGVSGNDFGGVTLLQLSYPNPESLFSGASFGFEGTPQCTVLMILFIVTAYVLYARKSVL
jgi:hypothetical protein